MPTMIDRLLKLIVTGALLIQTMVFLSAHFWFFELFSHYAIYYILIGSAISLALLFRRMFKSLLIIVVLIGINLGAIHPYLQIIDNNYNDLPTPDLTILANNYYYKNELQTDLVTLIEKEDPDIFMIHEANQAWFDSIDQLLEIYPYIGTTEFPGIKGMIIASKLPGEFHELKLGGNNSLEFKLFDNSLTVLAVHPTAPLVASFAEERNLQFTAFAQYAETIDTPLVMMGDYNSTPWSPIFEDFLKESGLTDARIGHGIINTWHANNWLFKLPIDHALVSDDLQVIDFYGTEPLSSDHLPIVVKLLLP